MRYPLIIAKLADYELFNPAQRTTKRRIFSAQFPEFTLEKPSY
jgi:hypothetical protein